MADTNAVRVLLCSLIAAVAWGNGCKKPANEPADEEDDKPAPLTESQKIRYAQSPAHAFASLIDKGDGETAKKLVIPDPAGLAAVDEIIELLRGKAKLRDAIFNKFGEPGVKQLGLDSKETYFDMALESSVVVGPDWVRFESPDFVVRLTDGQWLVDFRPDNSDPRRKEAFDFLARFGPVAARVNRGELKTIREVAIALRPPQRRSPTTR